MRGVRVARVRLPQSRYQGHVGIFNGGRMQTIEEYKAYTRQLENEVGKWHHAYDALMVERNQLVNRIMELETENKQLKGE